MFDCLVMVGFVGFFFALMLAKVMVEQNDNQNVPWLPEERGKVQAGQKFGPRIAVFDNHSLLSVI